MARLKADYVVSPLRQTLRSIVQGWPARRPSGAALWEATQPTAMSLTSQMYGSNTP